MDYLKMLQRISIQRNLFYQKAISDRSMHELEKIRNEYHLVWSNVIDSATNGILNIEELEKIKIAHINDEKYLKTEFDTDFTDLLNLCLSNSESGFGKLREFLVNIWSDGIISNEERKAVDEYVQKSELNYSKASLIIREIRDQYATKDLRSIIAGYGGEVLEWPELRLMQTISSDYNINPMTLNLGELRSCLDHFRGELNNVVANEGNSDSSKELNSNQSDCKYIRFGWKWRAIEHLDHDDENFLDFNSHLKEIYYAPLLLQIIPDEETFLRITFTIVNSPKIEGKKLLRKMLNLGEVFRSN